MAGPSFPGVFLPLYSTYRKNTCLQDFKARVEILTKTVQRDHVRGWLQCFAGVLSVPEVSESEWGGLEIVAVIGAPIQCYPSTRAIRVAALRVHC